MASGTHSAGGPEVEQRLSSILFTECFHVDFRLLPGWQSRVVVRAPGGSCAH